MKQRVAQVSEALRALCPDAVWVMEDGNIEWLSPEISQPSNVEIAAELARIQAEYDASFYQQQRRSEYPAIGDQLDALFHAGVFPPEMAAQIQAIKDKYPKGTA